MLLCWELHLAKTESHVSLGPKGEKRIHRLFILGLIGKGIFALLDILGGILLAIVHVDWISREIGVVVQKYIDVRLWLRTLMYVNPDSISTNPHDAFAVFLLRFAEHLSLNTKSFMVAYLLVTGFVKLFLVIGMYKNRLWVFPCAIVALSGFVFYLIYRFFFVTYSYSLPIFAFFDVVIIGLIFHTYRELKRSR